MERITAVQSEINIFQSTVDLVGHMDLPQLLLIESTLQERDNGQVLTCPLKISYLAVTLEVAMEDMILVCGTMLITKEFHQKLAITTKQRTLDVMLCNNVEPAHLEVDVHQSLQDLTKDTK